MSENGPREHGSDVEKGAPGKGARWHRVAKFTVSTSMVVFVGLTLALEIAVQLASVPSLGVTAVESVRFFAEDGTLLREAVDVTGMRARFVPREKLSNGIVTATIAVEDVRFHEHRGVDPRSTARAIYENVRAQKVVRGASTLTMQLVRLLRPHSTTLAGKVQEAVTALAMERAYTKDQIIEGYLNQATYGAGTRGIEAAAVRYFGRSHRDLSLAQVALLAGLPKAPTALNPRRHPDAALKRRDLVLRRLRSVVDVKMVPGISAEEIERALREPLSLAVVDNSEPLAMHFSEWVTKEWAERATEVGAVSLGTSAAAAALQGDVVTTIESDWQRQSQNLVGQHIAALQAGGGRDAAVVIVDNATCGVRVMVGSAGYFNARGGAVNAATSLRQPGSTLKPFTYALAFEAGHSPRTVVADIESFYGAPNGVVFRPRNYSKVFHGPVLMGEALGRSLNVPAIRTMGLLEIGALLRRMRKLGVTSLTKSAEHYGLGLTLGNGEVTLVELVGAYAALARGGVPCVPAGLQTVASATNTPLGARVIDGDVVAMVTHILSDEVLRQRAFGPRNALMLGFPMAIKTGTSSNWRDTWAIGYTREITIGVWTGDVEGAPTHGLAGATGAGPLFHQIAKAFVPKARKMFSGLHPKTPSGPAAKANAKPASSLVDVEVCALSGLLPQQYCDHRATVRVRQSDVPLKSCHWHRSVEVDTRNGLRAGKGCPKKFVTAHQVVALPAAYAEWQQKSVLAVMPSSTSPLCPDSGAVPDAVVVRYPRAGEVFIIEPGYDRARQSIQLRGEIDPATSKAQWIVDGSVVENVEWPYVGDWALMPGHHVVQLRANKRLSDPVAFEVR